MENSKNLGFYLPSSNTSDIAEINQIADNFRKIDELVPKLQAYGSALKYELIETIEVTKPAVISRTNEPNGKPYDFKAMCVKIRATAGISGNTYWSFWNNDMVLASGCMEPYSSGQKWAFAEAFIDNGWWRSNYAGWSGKDGILSLRSGYESFFLSRSEKDYPKITKLYESSGALPAGTIVEIWGARA